MVWHLESGYVTAFKAKPAEVLATWKIKKLPPVMRVLVENCDPIEDEEELESTALNKVTPIERFPDPEKAKSIGEFFIRLQNDPDTLRRASKMAGVEGVDGLDPDFVQRLSVALS